MCDVDFEYPWNEKVEREVLKQTIILKDIKNYVNIYLLLRRAWQPTPVFLPGESHGQRSLAGYSPQGLKESDMTEVT